jgi:trimethyllysine dioxygenase
MNVPAITSIDITADGLHVAFVAHPMPEFYSWFWLRDHSQDPTRYDAHTKQRKVDTFALDPLVYGVEATLIGDLVRITWSDLSDPGLYSTRLLAEVAGLVDCNAPTTYWAKPPSARDLRRILFKDVVTTDEGLTSWLDEIATVGYGLVRDMPRSHAGAEALARRIGYPRETIFGGLWTLSSEMTDHNDSAYSQTFLEPHTDSTYSTDAPGLQMFCCVEREGEGGESILVDGFALAEQLRREEPLAFDILTRVVVRSHYLEPGIHLTAERPVIRLDRRGIVEQVSFNNYDRAPFRLPPSEEVAFYRAYAKFHELLNDRDSWLVVRLDPGDALLFDNWRTLHGRMAYTGRRVFVGCYHNREDFESRRRVLQQTIAATNAARATGA